jgi:urea transport system ATP-binding protein
VAAQLAKECKARGLKLNPKLLLLDEPTEGIQPSIVDQIEDVIIGFKN